jgi:anti-sigma B factor antagonist
MDVLSSHAAFGVYSRRVGSCQMIELIGELDLGTAPLLEAAIDQMAGPDQIKVDMSRLDFIDSTGLRLLLRASELVDGRIWLTGSSLFIGKVFEMAGVSDFFHFSDDRDSAQAQMGRRPTG